MGVRSTESLVTLNDSFMLAALDSPQPAGTYRLIVDEEEIDGLSFIAYRRIATMLHLPAIGVSALSRQVILVDPDELAAVLRADLNCRSVDEKTEGTR